jgi:type I restriction enzyme, R subunit
VTTEADTCRTHVLPALYSAGWTDEQIAEQSFFTDGRLIVSGRGARRGKRKFADYLLRYQPDLPLAVVEAKAEYKLATDGLEQAKEYARILGVPFAYATNGPEIVEYDDLTKLTIHVAAYPSPETLWTRLRDAQGLASNAATKPLLTPDYPTPGRPPRYYQRIAINRAVQAIAKGDRRVLLTLATGTGKTTVAFQICWKLFESRWNLEGKTHRPRILFLADRDVLVGDPMSDDFAPFGEARWRISGGNALPSRSMYFATYQALTGDGSGRPLYEEYPRNFFDLIVVDECHRGSARDDSVWRAILEYFAPAAQIGMTATPLRDETRDSYEYFGDPLYTYSLRDGINDGFLAPYRVHRVVTDVDAAGWRPTAGQLDRYGEEVPDDEYGTPDFERKVALRARTEAIAGHLAHFLEETNPMAKTMIFCVDQEHASEMAIVLGNRLREQVAEHTDYVARVTADEGEVGRAHLSNFQDIDRPSPVILTTSQLLTTGVDAPMCTNVVLARIVGSMVEFKQIIGRGTRVREDYGKTSFNIVDYTGSATQHFADPDFDGEPVRVDVIAIDPGGEEIGGETLIDTPPDEQEGESLEGIEEEDDDTRTGRRKYYVDGGIVEIATHFVYDLDPEGNVLRIIRLDDYTADKVRTLATSEDDLRALWIDPTRRDELLLRLEEAGLSPEDLAEKLGQRETDTFDLLCHLAFNAPLRSRRERAAKVAREQAEFFAKYGPEARAILNDLLEKYAQHGVTQLRLPDVLKLPPISNRGNPAEIVRAFGGAQSLRTAVSDLQRLLYDEPDAA